MSATIRPLLAAAALVAALAACDDPYERDAQTIVVADTVVLYDMNEAPIGAPTAYYLLGAPTGGGATLANSAFAFDVAVTVQPGGAVRLITPRSLVGVVPDPSAPPYRVGLRLVEGSFEALTLAPDREYAYDSLLTVTPGQTVAIQSANPRGCPLVYYGTVYYAKLVVDSVKTDPARAYMRVTTDPNCDFRSLVPGAIPEE